MANSKVEDKENEEREKRWRAESDLRTLRDADDIRKDKERMKAAAAMAKEQMTSLESISKIGEKK